MRARLKMLGVFLLDQFITVGDAVSQLAGRFLPCWYEGRLHRYTRSANESISGASNWHADNDRWPWVEVVIDVLALLISFGKDRQHCLKARISDRSRAGELLAADTPKRELKL